ncbi:hypothetical protein Tco_0183849 [Tanacetum coccineum]
MNDVDLLLRRLKQNVSLLEEFKLEGDHNPIVIQPPCYSASKFKNILLNGPYVPITAGQRKPEGQWIADERKAANLDQRLKSLILSVLPDDQMNSVINYETAKSTWEDLILYHEVPSDVKESRVDLKLCYNTFNFKEDYALASLFDKLKYEENLIDNIYETKKKKSLTTATPLSTVFFSTSNVQDFQDSPDDEEDTRSSEEYLKGLDEEYHERALLAKSKRFFKKGSQRSTKDFETKYNKVKAKLALLSSGTSASKSSMVKNKGLVAEAYEWDEEEVSSDDNEMVEVKVLMALSDEENVVGKESARNGEWVKISMTKGHTLLDMEDNDERKSFLDYLCIDLNYVEDQRNNLVLKHRDLVHESNTCKEQLLVLKQAKLDLLTMQHLNTKILKENQNLRNELKELTSITEAWLNGSNKVNQCISEQIPTQKKKILRIDQPTKDTSSSGLKDPVFVISLADNSKVSIIGSNKPKLSEAEDSTLSNHNTSKVPSNESQRNTTDHSVVVSDSSATDYDSADESSVYSTPFPPLVKLTGAEPLLLEATKVLQLLKTNSAPAGKLKNVKMEDDPPLDILMKELNELKLQISKNNIILVKVNLPQDPDLQGQQYLFLPAYIVDIMIINMMIVYTIPYVKYVEAMIMILPVITGLFLYEEESNLETLNMSQRTMKHVVVMFIPHQIIMTLSGSGKEKLFKLRKLSLSKQCNIRGSLS